MKFFVLNIGEILIDEIDIPVVQLAKWALSAGYVRGSSAGKYRGEFLHRIIAERMGYILDDEVDHFDGNILNNQRLNLRPATHMENMRNTKIQVNNVSGFKGVYYRKERNKWISTIQVAGKRIYLGYFDTSEEANEAYEEAANEYFGEFVRI